MSPRDSPSATTRRGAFGNRIDPASITLNGTTLDPAGTYRIVTNSFLAYGGDSFSVFTEGTNRRTAATTSPLSPSYLGTKSPVAPPPDRITGI